jgi:glycosyltransferase involved in cell wall biosynthesis
LAANSTIQHDVFRAMGIKPRVLIETGIRSQASTANRPLRSATRPFRILWSGLLIPRKALNLLIEALAQLPDDIPYELHVMGDGPMRQKWQRQAERLGVNLHIQWKGWVRHSEALEEYASADVFVFTSLRDTTGTVILEALGAGLPVIGLDHQGVRDVVTPDCGIKVPVTTPKRVIAELAESLTKLARDPSEQERLARGALERGGRYLWSRLGEEMSSVYREVLETAGTPAPAHEFDFSIRGEPAPAVAAPATGVSETPLQECLVAKAV